MSETYSIPYETKLRQLREEFDENRAMELLVGGNFVAQGILEKSLLQTLGLKPTDRIVDVGCGSGRLAFALCRDHAGDYIGTDILPEALAFARQKVGREGWSFLRTDKPEIPAPDGSADFVTFFSVFTHLEDVDCFRFLTEARRVAKPGGLIVISFLDFDVAAHWPVFQNSVNDTSPTPVLNRFHAKSVLQKWAQILNLTVEQVVDGNFPYIKLENAITFDDGRVQDGVVEFGQSLCILRAPDATAPAHSVTKRETSVPQIVVADGQVCNMSVRANVGHSERALLSGFSILNAPRRVLIRGIGPALAPFGIEAHCREPMFHVMDAKGAPLFKSTPYVALDELRHLYTQTFAECGAFHLKPEARDAVLMATLPAGTYTVLFASAEPGVGVLEIYTLPVARFSEDQVGRSCQ